jgi:two-component system sensor histidine kinase AlgZ
MPPQKPPSPSMRPLDALWRPVALAWIVAAGEGLAGVLALAPGLVEDRWLYFAVTSLWVQWVSLSTLGVLYAARGFLGAIPPVTVGAIALVVALLFCWLLTWAARSYYGPIAGPEAIDWPRLARLASGITLVVGFLGLAIFDNYWRGQRHALNARQAQLEALQARIRPHFLFNTLNTGAALVHARPGEAERLLLDLADLFRAALSGPREIPLADELALARRYLEIEALRFGPRLRLHWDLPEQIPEVLVPTLSIQPLVENAIRHGVEPSGEGGAVDVSVMLEPSVVRIVIRNDLPPGGHRPANGHHVGLLSSRERILALSQGRGRLDTEVVDGRYVATITLPRHTA